MRRNFSRGEERFFENYQQRKQIFQKTGQRNCFWHLSENFDRKVTGSFGTRSPLKISYFGAKGALRKFFEFAQPKIDTVKLLQMGTLWKNLTTRTKVAASPPWHATEGTVNLNV